MKRSKQKLVFLFSLLFYFFSFSAFVCAQTINKQGDFTIQVDSLKKDIFSDNLNQNFEFTITNNKNYKQLISLNSSAKDNWIINISKKSLFLKPNEQIKVNVQIKPGSNFNYEKDIVSPDMIKISQRDNYIGTFEFPILVSGENENISLNFVLEVSEKKDIDEVYTAEFSTNTVSPQKPLGFVVKGENINEDQKLHIILKIAGLKFETEDIFTKNNNYKIYQQKLPNTVSPDSYPTQLTLRLEKSNKVVWEWTTQKDIIVEKWHNLKTEESKQNNIFEDTYTILVKNNGNVKENFQTERNISSLMSLFFTSTNDYIKTDNKVRFNIQLSPNEEKEIVYSYNYIPIYFFAIIILVLAMYILYKKNSNPLAIDTKIYDIKKVKYEGVKVVKFEIGFENIKNITMESVLVNFRMPSYLKVKEGSFLLTEPNHILKGKNQYKLVWKFKGFVENDSRILGFTLVNNRGILGDIKIPNLEFEVKIGGKIKRYTKSFPIIRG